MIGKRKKRVLITGAAGFIGGHLLRYFHNLGYETQGWIRSNSILFDTIYSIKKVDMSSPEEIRNVVESFKPNIIIHCAGIGNVGYSIEHPFDDYESNVTILHNLLFSIKSLSYNPKVVFLSSAGVYGNPSKLPICEDDLLSPISPYALHKYMSEEVCDYFIKNFDADISIARIFSVYGPGLKKQIFWDMWNKSQLATEIHMFGTGDESRDYIYIDDLVQAIFLIATNETDEYIFNIANGEEITIKEVSYMYAEALGIDKARIVFDGTIRKGDPMNWKADIDRLFKIGYVKKVNLMDGLKQYVKWLKTI